tara:strand:+ start:826 stop:4032 length:3207 start_codon:yes stop_codon:yes gene_type:complete
MEIKDNILKNKVNQKTTPEVINLIEQKLGFYKNILQKTYIYIQHNKNRNILTVSDVGACIEKLNKINDNIHNFLLNSLDVTILTNNLQTINNEFSILMKNYGTHSLDDLLLTCFGKNYNLFNDSECIKNLNILKKYFHPISYKVIEKVEGTNKSFKLTCTDLSISSDNFFMKINGINLIVYNETSNNGLIISGYLDDLNFDYLHEDCITTKHKWIVDNKHTENIEETEVFDHFLSSLVLKDYLLCGEDDKYIYHKYNGYINCSFKMRQNQLSQVIKEFSNEELFSKRYTLMSLLIDPTNYDAQYLSYLLYDLLTNEPNDKNEIIDTEQQKILYDSFPTSIKKHFKLAMKKTIQYTTNLLNYDVNKIPVEQQICLMKTSDDVKEKALIKLKEVKSKTEDSGSKARQYLDGLLKVPFGIYKKEPILTVMDKIRLKFLDTFVVNDIKNNIHEIPKKDKYTNVEILKYTSLIKNKINLTEGHYSIEDLLNHLIVGNKKKLINNIDELNVLLKNNNFTEKLKPTVSTKPQLINQINEFCNLAKLSENINLFNSACDAFIKIPIKNNKIIKSIDSIKTDMEFISNYITTVKTTLDESIHGHDKAKKQIEMIISQWINGTQDGYCFGFEGPPGVGKTSLAKRGLSNCLKDENGNSRPFAMIQMGGDSNGSTIQGHNYTYVGSTWGSIVQILMDKKCMNPIIFIDEVDKISKTEHGREIVGILTHLLDQTQNDSFQDKYFNGIDLDLSKALFVLSYNDPSAIDSILLDRIHRIKFGSLNLEDKITICKTHILQEIYTKNGLDGIIFLSDEVIKFVIEEYTMESGVRKLKEVLFEIVGEINLEILKNYETVVDFPINITKDDLRNKYFKDKREIIIRKVPEVKMVGYANGMYATSLGNGGTLPIHAKLFPAPQFLELKLTGLQQDVMRESMHVSLTVAWNLTNKDRQCELRKLYDGENNKYGINIHPGDGSVQKDGPSAGGIITVVLYSLLNDIPIRPKIAMTGEVQMTGDITAIGGLNYKILGSIKAGVTEFLYPKENKKDFDEFYEKYKTDTLLTGIIFHEISNVSEALEIMLDK